MAVNPGMVSYGPTGVPADDFDACLCEPSPSKAAKVLPSLFRQASATHAWTQACGGLSEAGALNAAQSSRVWKEGRGKWLAHLADPHPAILTGLHIFLASLPEYTCPIKVTGFSAGSYTGTVIARLLVYRRTPFKSILITSCNFSWAPLPYPKE